MPTLGILAALRAPVVARQSHSDPRSDPWFANPTLRKMMEALTFHLSFDAGSMVPEMASGDATNKVNGKPLFFPGLRGLSLLAGGGSGSAWYPQALNFPIGTRGAMTMWVCPVEWTHVNGDNTVFAMTGNSTFYIERQGPGHNEKGELTRQECVLFLVTTPKAGSQCLTFGTGDWPMGKWRLLVANWNWPDVAFSLDGGPFQIGSLQARPSEAEFGALLIGAEGGETTLLDDIFIFRRPLTEAEAKMLYETFKPAEKGDK